MVPVVALEAVALEVLAASAAAHRVTAAIAICSVVPDSPLAQAIPLLSVLPQVAARLQRVMQEGKRKKQPLTPALPPPGGREWIE